MSKIAVILCSELLVFLSSGAFWSRDEKSISGVICVALTGKEILVRPDYTPRSTEPPSRPDIQATPSNSQTGLYDGREQE